ncbi:hypothetical protein DAI22_11g137100 [Oryza sativa Japonica Group]|nr:hypothetical protein DAI22_11g137100 [Oryza sativa Japonica Group]
MPREPAAAEDVVARLGTDEATGLTGEEAARLLKLYGPNLVADHPLAGGRLLATLKCILLLLGWDHSFTEEMVCVMFINSSSWVAMAAALVYLAINSAGQTIPTHVFSAHFVLTRVHPGRIFRSTTYELAVIVSLLAGSLCACFVAKVLANRAKAPLEAKAFVRRTKVLRDGIWKHEDAANLVPGDIIYLKCGDIVPANACVLNMAQIDTKTIRHERHVSYVMGSLIYYGWAVSCGEGTAVVTATGNCIPTSTLKLYPRRFSRPGQLRKGVMATGTFCFCLVLVGITSSRRLSKLGVASRGTFALEDLASMDAMLFNMTGTLTCNKPYFDKDKIEVLTDGIDKDHAVLLAARASKAHNELYKEPIDAAILGLMDDPEQVRVGINVIEHRSRMFVAMTLMYMTTYIDGNGSKCSVLKGDPALMLRDCSCSNEVKEHIRKRIDTLGLDGHQCIAVGRIVNSRLDIISLLPFIDDLRGDSAEAVVNLTDMSLSVIVLTESPMTITKHVCGRLGKLGLNVLHADSMREMVSSKNELFLNINGISDLFVEYNRYVISNLRTYFGRRSAMVGYEFSDADSIRESDIGIAVADATDSTKSESDIVLTEHALLCVSSAVQTSREICQIMKGCMVYAVSSTVHAFTVRLILLLWRLELPCFPMLVIAACNYCTSTAMLFERAKSSQSPDSLKAKKIIVTGAAFGSYVALSTVVFFIFTTRTDFISHIFKARLLRLLVGHDEEIKSALFLQMSILNHAVGLFAQSCDGHCSGPLVTISFVLSQLVATVIAVYGVANSPLPKGIGWGWAGFIWLYNFVLLLSLMLICYLCNLAKFNISGITCRRLFTSWTQWMEKCRRVLNRGQMWMVMLIFPAISGLILVWSICAYHAMKVQQQ